MNPLAGNNPMMQQIANALNMARGNPQAMFQQLSQRNPQAAQQVQQMMQSGQNPKDIATAQLRQMGIDPEQLMRMMNNGR